MKGDAFGVVFSTFSGNRSVMSASGGTGFMRGFIGSGSIFLFGIAFLLSIRVTNFCILTCYSILTLNLENFAVNYLLSTRINFR